MDSGSEQQRIFSKNQSRTSTNLILMDFNFHEEGCHIYTHMVIYMKQIVDINCLIVWI